MEYYAAGVLLKPTGLLDIENIYTLYEVLNKQGLYIIGGDFTELNEDLITTPAYENSKYEIANKFIKAVCNLPERYQERFPDEFYIFVDKHIINYKSSLFVVKTEKLPIEVQRCNYNIKQLLKVWRR